MAADMKQTLKLKNRAYRPMQAQPITYGVPWPEGALRDVGALALRDENGARLPAGFTALNAWPDGSVQWSLVDFMLDFGPAAGRSVSVEARRGRTPAPPHPVQASVKGAAATIGNGLVEITVSGRRPGFLKSWTYSGKELVRKGGLDVTFLDKAGKQYSLSLGRRKVTVEHLNPLRGVLRVDGKHGADDGSEMLDYFLRIEVRADRPDVKLTYSFRNRELPTPGIEIRSLCLTADAAASGAKRCFIANNIGRHYLHTFMRVDEDPEIVTSDTGDLDNYEATHKPGARGDCFVRDPAVLHDPPEGKPWFLQDPKYRLQAGGNRCTWPYLALVGEEGGIVGAFGQMVCLHPKSLKSEGPALRFGIWPDWAGSLLITQGAGRSHAVYLAPVPAGASDEHIQNRYLSWEFGGFYTHVPPASPITIMPDLEHVRRCCVFAIDKLPPYEPEAHLYFERKVMDAWLGVTYGQLGAMTEVQPAPGSGFWDYGDHGANNEEMFALVYMQNYLRSGVWGCAEVGLAVATHIMEVDFVDFSVDHFQHGGMVSHCLHHNDGAAYPSHMWFTELLFAYALTGDAEYKRAALRICENLLHWIDMDDGFAVIAADEREAGQPMINLTWCYEFNRDPRYLQGCSKIIREGLMANTARYGHMMSPRPFNMEPVKVAPYGDYASWEGMFWYWEITRDEEVKGFVLDQLKWRLELERCGMHGGHRSTDYNPAAYAYYMSGDESWLTRVARPFRGAFRAAKWPLGWVHSMYYIKLAFEHGIVTDDDVIVQ